MMVVNNIYYVNQGRINEKLKYAPFFIACLQVVIQATDRHV
ncbi:hypothetical protein ASZ90_018841 [hydrocarbon metagenome]|uniref:Uncharacterized protein n=1 Tax=hydrocarbon metagenome TaxID=938273 RepID=A0A0W8E526_9ZZZZ